MKEQMMADHLLLLLGHSGVKVTADDSHDHEMNHSRPHQTHLSVTATRKVCLKENWSLVKTFTLVTSILGMLSQSKLQLHSVSCDFWGFPENQMIRITRIIASSFIPSILGSWMQKSTRLQLPLSETEKEQHEGRGFVGGGSHGSLSFSGTRFRFTIRRMTSFLSDGWTGG